MPARPHNPEAQPLWKAALCAVALVLFGGALGPAAHGQTTPIYSSGGALMPEQAAYDVTYYDLAIDVRPADSSVSGQMQVHADVVQPLEWFVLNLDTTLAIRSVALVPEEGERRERPFERRGGQVWIPFLDVKQPGARARVEVIYDGQPRVAPNPPWEGGFQWTRTPEGAHWIATSNQQEGADLWWPVKDHVSDEPDSMAIDITVPEPLVAASNGRLRGVEPASGDRRTYHWFVSTPINAYNIALNIAPYRVVEERYESVAGEAFPIKFWVLPSRYEKGQAFLSEIRRQLRFYEETVGPYPFRADKLGVVQTPHLGMEHQTIIAYGADFDNTALSSKDWGFDTLLQHELSHEWWGNLVTNLDWRDMWLHEGFGSYMQALYAEELAGEEGYHEFADGYLESPDEERPIAPRETQTSKEIYQADIYGKGAGTLHTLRYLIGDEAFFEALRRMAYPDAQRRQATGGAQTRFATTRGFVNIAEEAAGRELDWFFEVYVREAQLPRLQAERQGATLRLRWEVPSGHAFPMPVDVKAGETTQRVEVSASDWTAVSLPSAEAEPTIDPQNWVMYHHDAAE